MANTLTALAPVLYSAAQNVSNEPFAAVKSINTLFDDKGVAKGDSVYVPIAPMAAAADFTPAATPPEGDAKTAANVVVQITAAKKVSWNLTGEQIRSLENSGTDKEWVRQLVAQGMRALRNLAEVDAITAIRKGASRAVGTAATTPFVSDLTALTSAYKVLKDNGAPMADLQLLVDTAAGLKLRNLGIIQQAYQAGSDQERRSGNLLRQFGFQIQETAGISVVTKGTGASFVTNGVQAVKTTSLVVKSGTGTVNDGDVVTFAADSVNKYVVGTGTAVATGPIVLNRPGTLVSIADANAITVGGDFTPNLAFEKSSVVGVIRPPIIPDNPTINQMSISDDFGMTYLLLDIAQYGQRTWELHVAWGFKAVQPEHICLLMG